jgi:hypothetical protein
MIVKIALAATMVSGLCAPAMARDGHHDRGRHDHHYRDYDDIRLRGPGVDDLHPWFRNARAGREYAASRAGFHISNREAWMLNREAPYRTGERRDYRRRSWGMR